MERRKRIVQAAKKVFLEKGYFDTSIREIAVTAELSPGAIYYYFGGIDELYAEICDESFRLINELLERQSRRRASARTKLESMSRAFLEYYRRYPEYFDLFAFSDLGWRRVGLKAELQQRLDQALARAISILHQTIEEGIRAGEIATHANSRQVAYAFWGGIEGVLCLHRRGLLENAEFSIDQLVNTQVRMALSGITSNT